MQITLFGLSSFKIQTKDATVITDPFDKSFGLTPPRGAADIIVLSENENPKISSISGISGSPFTIENPGEYDLKGVTIAGIPLKQGDSYVTIYLIEAEDLKILFLAHISDFNIKQEDLESLGEIHILMLPVGGESVMSASKAVEVINAVDPKVVIPTYYKSTGVTTKLDTIDKFLKEYGTTGESMEKLSIKKKELPTEGTRVVILN